MGAIRRIKDFLLAKRKFKRNKSSFGKKCTFRNYGLIDLKDGVRIKNYAKIELFTKWNGKELKPSLSIGKNVIINDYFTAYITSKCQIGDETIFAHNVTIVTENHGINPEIELPFHRQDLTTSDVIIGKNCWIGANVVFLPNSKIGDNCVVAANCVVNDVFPSNCMIGGVPCKLLRVFDFNQHKWVKPNEK